MKKIKNFFGGSNMKYWYVAFAIVLICVIVSMINNRAVTTYNLYIYNPDGSVQNIIPVEAGYYESERMSLPVSKMFVPNKLF